MTRTRILAAIVATLAAFGILAALPADPWQTLTGSPTRPVSNLDVSPVGCWVESDGEPLSGALDLMPEGSTVIDCADLDAYAAVQPCVILPLYYAPETTPTVVQDGCAYPEESPDGGYLTGRYLDNSPTYGDGWTLLVDDTTGDVTWTDALDTSAAE